MDCTDTPGKILIQNCDVKLRKLTPTQCLTRAGKHVVAGFGVNSPRMAAKKKKSSPAIKQETPTKNTALLRQLVSDLSPKYLTLNVATNGRTSRYGRPQKIKESADFLAPDVLTAMKKSLMSPPPTLSTKPATRRPRSLPATPLNVSSLAKPNAKLSPLKQSAMILPVLANGNCKTYNPWLTMLPAPGKSNAEPFVSPVDKLIELNKKARCTKSSPTNFSKRGGSGSGKRLGSSEIICTSPVTSWSVVPKRLYFDSEPTVSQRTRNSVYSSSGAWVNNKSLRKAKRLERRRKNIVKWEEVDMDIPITLELDNADVNLLSETDLLVKTDALPLCSVDCEPEKAFSIGMQLPPIDAPQPEETQSIDVLQLLEQPQAIDVPQLVQPMSMDLPPPEEPKPIDVPPPEEPKPCDVRQLEEPMPIDVRQPEEPKPIDVRQPEEPIDVPQIEEPLPMDVSGSKETLTIYQIKLEESWPIDVAQPEVVVPQPEAKLPPEDTDPDVSVSLNTTIDIPVATTSAVLLTDGEPLTPILIDEKYINLMPVKTEMAAATSPVYHDINYNMATKEEASDVEHQNKFSTSSICDLVESCLSVSSGDSAIGTSISSYEEPTTWKIGQLAWARLSPSPLWPSIVCPDPDGLHMQTKKNKTSWHVKFFADNGRRNWISSGSMLPFNGIDQFEQERNASTNKPMFNVKSQLRIRWQLAVVEAQMLAMFSCEERLTVFEKTLKDNSLVKLPLQAVEHVPMTSHDLHKLLSEVNQRAMTPIMSPLLTPSTSRVDLRRISWEDSPAVQLPTTDQPNDQHIHSYLMSLPSSSSYQSPSSSSSSRTAANEDLADLQLSSQSTSYTQLNLIELDDYFEPFYAALKAALPPYTSDPIFEHAIRQLAIKKWLLTVIELHKKFTSQRRRSKVTPPQKIEKTTISPLATDLSSSAAAKSQRIRFTSIRDNETIIKSQTAELQGILMQREAKHNARFEEHVKRTAAKKQLLDIEMSKYFMQQYPKLHIFKGLQREFVCSICFKPSDVVKCALSTCHEHIHVACASKKELMVSQTAANSSVLMKKVKASMKKSIPTPLPFHVTGEDCVEMPVVPADVTLCKHCSQHDSLVCFCCKTGATATSTLLRCIEKLCGRHYHMSCLKLWPQAKVLSEYDGTMICPCHCCHTCSSDDPGGKHYYTENSKITWCVQCLATYHMDSCCIPAGSELLTASQLICPRHRVEKRKPINADWCFICAQGGSLVCCETCPTVFHSECLRIPVADKYICEECETGRLPLYGEMVWAKLGNCPWWPSVILPPWVVSERLANVEHQRHDFCIQFFGTNNFTWISRGFVYLYQNGDANIPTSNAKKSYLKALVEAHEWAERVDAMKALHPQPKYELQPMPYLKIRTNKPIPPVCLNDYVLDKAEQCACDPHAKDPCGPHSGCLNRFLQIECDPNLCMAGDQCQNQKFHRQEYPNVMLKHMGARGFGLVTLVDIQRGAFVIEYVGELINGKEYELRQQQKYAAKVYFLLINRDLYIDAGPRGNNARFINHSCEPNCETQVWTVFDNERVGFFAIDDIPANTELTFNYKLKNSGGMTKCECGASKCAGYIGAKYVSKELITSNSTETQPDAIVSKVQPRKRKPKTKTAKSNLEQLVNIKSIKLDPQNSAEESTAVCVAPVTEATKDNVTNDTADTATALPATKRKRQQQQHEGSEIGDDTYIVDAKRSRLHKSPGSIEGSSKA